MRRSVLVLTVFAAAAATITLAAQAPPYGNVKTFAGDITIDAKRTSTPGWSGRGTTVEELHAVGPARLTDNAMPDGAHMTWPMLAPAEMATNPAGMKQWRAQVTFTATDTAPRDNAHMGAQNIVCKFAGMMQGIASIGAPSGRTYALGIHLGTITAQCTGTNEDGQKVNESRQFDGPPQFSIQGTAPGAIGGNKVLTEEDWSIKVIYSFAQAR